MITCNHNSKESNMCEEHCIVCELIKKCNCEKYHHNKCPYFLRNEKNEVDGSEWEEEFRRVFHGTRIITPEHRSILRNAINHLISQKEKEVKERIFSKLPDYKINKDYMGFQPHQGIQDISNY